MANWIDEATFAPVSIDDASWTLLLAREKQRRFLAVRNNSGELIFVAYTNTEPVDANGDAGDRMVNGEKIYWDAAVMPTTDLWVWQSSGGAVNVHVASAQ